MQAFVDFVTVKKIQPVTQYARDNWPAKPGEFYAEAFSLWHNDPVFFQGYSSDFGCPSSARLTTRVEPLLPELSAAEAEFGRASQAYEAQRFAEAAAGFLEAARKLRIGGVYADSFTGNRRYCYRNAASAFSRG